MKWHRVYWILGSLFFLVGIFLPYDWFDALPTKADLPPPPIKGITLLQIIFIFEGLVFLWLAFKQITFRRLREEERFPKIVASDTKEAVSHRASLWILISITMLALLLRLFHINSGLWLDEISPILNYGHLSPLQVIGTFFNTNNHMLNTLLVNFSIACFGENEWAIRLPAVFFGIATIPALYWLSRLTLSRLGSLSVALLLTVSYHHIFFSQNARGYSAYLFFSLVSSVLFVKGLKEDKARIWILYILMMFLDFAALLNSSFVFASHIIVGGIALIIVKSRGISPIPLLRRLIGIFGITGFLVFQLYATIFPTVYMIIHSVYTGSSSGFRLFSGEFLREMIRGLSAGFGTGLLLGVLPFFIVVIIGGIILFRRHWAITLALVMPCILTFTYLIIKGLTFTPRFFLLALPLSILAAVHGINSLGGLAARIAGKRDNIFAARFSTVVVLMACIISLTSLGYYYSVPKQAYRSSIEYIEKERKPGEIVIVIYVAEKGYRYYGKRFDIKEGEDYFYVRTVDTYEAVLSSHDVKNSFLVITFPRALRLDLPDLNKRILSDWTMIRTFPGTIGDGAISVWRYYQS